MSNYTPTVQIDKPSSNSTPDQKRQELIDRLLYLFGGSMESVNLWLSSPHPWLGGSTPMSYLDEGNIQGVESLVGAIEHGIPG